MTAHADRLKADATITMRITVSTRDLIDSAAAIEGKSRTEFMTETARAHAMDVLLDQRMFTLDADQSAAVADILTNPPPANDALRRLMHVKMPWG